MNILITGATGFIGQSLTQKLLIDSQHKLTLVLRNSELIPQATKSVLVGDLFPGTDWSQALSEIDIIIHLAARAHILSDQTSNPIEEFRKVNTLSTLSFAQQAAAHNVHQFIFISSIGVNGNQTDKTPFTMDMLPAPVEPYAISKHEAEIGLHQISTETDMKVVIIRPPLVYGAKAPGNFGRLIRTLADGIPLPLGAIHNQRSFVALDNVIDLITTCIDHPKAANQTFLVSDDEDLSTTELLQRMAKALGKPSRLIPIPSKLLTVGATFIGKQDMARRLCGSLQVDISHTKNTLDWKPPLSVDEALQKIANAYIK